MIEQVDWDCEVLTNYADENLGCKKRVASGISWVFSQVESAIILEDDCLPAPTFFSFCETLLQHYKNDERICMISGNNFQRGIQRNPYSYYFSKYPHIWGWATWRRAWQYWSDDPQQWTIFRKNQLLQSIHPNPDEYQYWVRIFDDIFYRQHPDTWDYLWTFACWSQGGLTILPRVNLVTNIGFRADATHTKMENSTNAYIPMFDISEVNHPPFHVINSQADEYSLGFCFDVNFAEPKNWIQITFKQYKILVKKIIKTLKKLNNFDSIKLIFVSR
ncbi:hypothetical protein [Gloeomargarita lithophora]|uniref:hypothetical protein n=1 Tax=Gloeomargarita lithophora TaxID=1188228 RepID=UPI001C12A221|nr:hypothetical protein [Gloeomargarita lithophora]